MSNPNQKNEQPKNEETVVFDGQKVSVPGIPFWVKGTCVALGVATTAAIVAETVESASRSNANFRFPEQAAGCVHFGETCR